MLKLNINDMCFYNGKTQIDIKTFRVFQEFLHQNNNLKGFIFRGQEDANFKLEPSIYRGQADKDLVRENMEFYLERFMIYARDRIENYNELKNDKKELWAIGQHHGLKTPLLDWSASPYIASFFAFENKLDVEKRSVFLLNAKRVNELYFENLYEFYKRGIKALGSNEELYEYITRFENDLDRGKVLDKFLQSKSFGTPSVQMKLLLKTAEKELLKIYSPFNGKNKRIINQRGLFTIFNTDIYMEDLIRKRYPDEKILIQVNFPNEIRDEVITRLDAMNINQLSLFPDLAGAALYTNSKKIEEIKKYDDVDLMCSDSEFEKKLDTW